MTCNATGRQPFRLASIFLFCLWLSWTGPSFSQEKNGQDAQALSGPGVAATDDYQVGIGDVLEVDVFGLDDLDRRTRVSVDGTIALPLLGAVSVSGLSLRQAEQRIAQILTDRELVKAPEVSIFVVELVSRPISVQGAVSQPGTYQLQGRQTLLDIIGQSGGMNSSAGRKIVVLREQADGSQERHEVDADELMTGEPSANLALKPGDIVMVALAQQVRIYVSGAVERPGAVEFLSSEGITVLQAITAAGGPTNRANVKKTTIMRRLPDGTQERISVNLKKIQKGKEEDLVLQKNDTVVVGEWFF